MSLESQYLERYKKTYFKVFGEQITDEEATDQFFRLVELVKIIRLSKLPSLVDNSLSHDRVPPKVDK